MGDLGHHYTIFMIAQCWNGQSYYWNGPSYSNLA